MLFKVGSDPCELDWDGVAADFEQFRSRGVRLVSDPAKDPELIGSTAGE